MNVIVKEPDTAELFESQCQILSRYSVFSSVASFINRLHSCPPSGLQFSAVRRLWALISITAFDRIVFKGKLSEKLVLLLLFLLFL